MKVKQIYAAVYANELDDELAEVMDTLRNGEVIDDDLLELEVPC